MGKVYVQTPFDKTFVNAVEYLSDNKLLSKQKFSGQLGIGANNLSQILNAERGVPKSKKEVAQVVLTNVYDVREEFLLKNELPILYHPLPESEEILPSKQMVLRLEYLEKKIAKLEKEISIIPELVKMSTELLYIKKKLEKLSQKEGHR